MAKKSTKRKPQKRAQKTTTKEIPIDKKSNRNILSISLVFICCMAMAIFSICYTMVTQKHLWTGHTALTSVIRDSVQTKVIDGIRGEILDHSGQVIARQTVAYTLAANFDTRSEEEKEEEDLIIQKQRQDVLQQAQEAGRTEQVEAALRVADEANADDYVEDPEAFAAALKSVLGDTIDEESIVELLKNGQEKGYSQIELGIGTKRIDRELKEKLEAMKIPGLSFIETTKREYPTTPFSSNMIGFAAYDDETGRISGKSGLEKTMDSYLGAEDGIERYRSTKLDQELSGGKEVIQEATHGDTITLTLDAGLQQTVEENMKETMKSSKANAAWCLVMDPETGKILAWASYPTFDQNTHLQIPSYNDNISEYLVEPGSVVKPLYYAMAIDAGVYPWNEKYRAGEFYYTVDSYSGQITRVASQDQTDYPPIMDALGNDYGILTYAEGLAHSSNIALCELLSRYLNKSDVARYVDDFDLFESTNIPFVNEIVGKLNIDQATDYMSSGFGQGSSLTMLALAKAYTAIFNDGKMMQPYVVESITDGLTGEVIQSFEPQVVGTPIKAETARETIDLMCGVMAEGMTGERFAIEGVDMALKTGTGEIYNPETGTYDKTNYTSTVLAAAPADDPKVIVLWGMQGKNYLNYSPDPFKNIMQAALQTANVNMSTEIVDNTTYQEWTSSSMPSLISHSLAYANQMLADTSVKMVVIGNGDTVVNQFPDTGTAINANDKVMILTNGTEWTMPDLTGWTRKDLTAFAQLTGLNISFTGAGRTIAQSISVDSPIESGMELTVQLA